ncbi:MAG: endopeptidase La [Bacteroidota bacterium]
METDHLELEEVQEISAEDNALQIVENVLPSHLTILPLTQRPVFPGMTIPLTFTGKDRIKALKRVFDEEDGKLGLVLAKDYNTEDYTQSAFYEVGVGYEIMRIVPIAPGTIQVLGKALHRFTRKQTLQLRPNIHWEITPNYPAKERTTPELKAYMLALSSEIKELLKLNPLFKEQVNMVVAELNYDAPGSSMDVISNLLSSDAELLQELLETFDLHERAELLLRLIKEELEIAKIQQKISQSIEVKVNKQQKEFFLREQLKAIKRELGMEKEEGESEIEKIERKLAEKDLSDEALKVVQSEIEKLKTLNAQSPDFNVTRNYLDTIADLPWGINSEDNNDIKDARSVLDQDHYGLDEVKERILEFLSTVIKRGKISGSIICLVGPPGVGKTSIGKSIAAALNRKFYRFSVGGMRDEAEIKGHRRTYIGAMPGKLIQALQRVETSNPVIMLDEIDKIGTSFRGDPASALLEVLDPEQNSTFMDHYLDLPFDLSNVLFVTTANQLDTIPGPLLDRMEIIRLAGYVKEEKVEIAKRYLIPKQLEEHGFESDEIQFSDEAIALVIDNYAREAGVRNLEKQFRKVIRKVALRQAEQDNFDFHIEKDQIVEYLGKASFRTEKLYNKDIAGVALGLAYTSMGGATLYVEATGIKGKGGSFKQTGQLGDVMRESSQIAHSYVRAKLSQESPDNHYFEEQQVHLHVPAGATPKDGPSAGITMALALYSLATNRPVKNDLGMTGELTLTGKVLPIGGVKEKTLGAKRVGISTLIFPADNQSDWEELPGYIKEGIEAHFVDYFDDVLSVALQ